MILVTGGTGLVGSHLLYHLTSQGIKVRALIRNKNNQNNVLRTFSFYSESPENLFSQIEWVIGDVTDIVSLEDAMEGIDKIYHTAAYVSFSPKNKQTVFDINVKGTANIVNLCLEKQISKLCYVSSIAALGQNENGLSVTEDILWKPSKHISTYSLSKYHAEMEVWRGITEGLNAVIINPAVILGPGDWTKGSPSIISAAAKGIPFYTKGSNGYVDVRDVVRSMVLAMDSRLSSERFILCSENISYHDLLTQLAISLHGIPPSKMANSMHLRLYQLFESLRSSIFNREPKFTNDTVAILQNISRYSNKKSIEILGIKYIPVHETIKFTCNIYNQEKKK